MKEDFKDFWDNHPFEGDKYRVNNMCIAETAWNVQQVKIDDLKDQIDRLESKHKALQVLCRMRSVVINAEKWSSLRPHIKNAIKYLDRKEKELK